ncbi:NAD(P)-binding domain-containing protein [Haliangium ochraceum]|uniref:FAD-dependent pyridine nucleotide-disulphide oxidoreductase n=1 Tax=Haliangium ochraceum (strain DSM 14365 / JCM 11303 / SMP-2) TaxID=502025 RepID=D0LK60_HALO1|nr:NAD(P)-binding domain-containing protein [Haliangium ochraceum]ACY13094.1 FAD-dependent pyridine nucleotide-disulphide oxidoreductase [Haliangium ochraceum DSM 14365]
MTSILLIAGGVMLVVVSHSAWVRFRREHGERAKDVWEDVAALGDDLVPASIHPNIDPDICIGSAACVNACPEKDVIGLVHGRAQLINPLACVGHGACAAACPVDAINLVFGTAKRGVELPVVDETFQTNQEGVYVVGELGGMGLIRNAIKQGREVGEYIAASERRGGGEVLDALVIGAGPAGISATLSLMNENMRVLLLEREEFGGTIVHYPRAKVVMTGVLEIPRYGKVRKRTMRKEDLVGLWEDIRANTDLPVQTGELVESLQQDAQGSWVAASTSGSYRAANVVLALGRRGSPRKLEVPGEELGKVYYRLIEPEMFRDKHVLVVGGGNAAAECALALSGDVGDNPHGGRCASISISYRRAEFARLRGQVREQLEAAIAGKRIHALLSTNVTAVSDLEVTLERDDGTTFSVYNDAVIIQVGGTPPTQLLNTFGVATETKYGEA